MDTSNAKRRRAQVVADEQHSDLVAHMGYRAPKGRGLSGALHEHVVEPNCNDLTGRDEFDVPWYPVVSLTRLEAVVSVGGQPVSVPRPRVEMRTTPPRQWTVLRNPTVAPRTPDVFRRGYLVCPGCRNRVPLGPGRRIPQRPPTREWRIDAFRLAARIYDRLPRESEEIRQ